MPDAPASEPGRTTESGTAAQLSALDLFVAVPAVWGACFVVVTKLGAVAGAQSLEAAAVLSILSTGALGAVLARCGVRVARPSVGQLAAVLAAPATMVALLLGPIRGVVFAPVTFSVDVAHHGALVAWIADHGALPTSFQPELAGQSRYPAGSHAVAALVARLSGQAPITAMWLVSLAWVVLVWWTAAAIATRLTGGRALALAATPVVVGLAAWRYTLGMVTYDYFYAQLGGMWLAWGVVAAIVAARRAGLPSWAVPGLGVLGVAAALLTYPQAAPVAALAVVGDALAGTGVGSRWHGRRLAGAAAAVVAMGVAALLVARGIGIDLAAIAGSGEGERAPLTLASVGGGLVAALLVVGLVELAACVRRRVPGAGAVVGATVAPGLLALGLAALRLPLFGSVPVIGYRIAKNAYTAAPGLLVGATVAVTAAATALWRAVGGERTPGRAAVLVRPVTALTGALVAGAAITAPVQRTVLERPSLSRSEQAASEWAHEHLDPADVGVAMRGLAGYHAWWIALRRPAEGATGVFGAPLRVTRWDTWPDGSPERHLVASGFLAQRAMAHEGVTVLHRVGDAVVLERAG